MDELNILYSVPFRIGNSGSSNPITAQQQIAGLLKQGVQVYLCTAGCKKPLDGLSGLKETLKPLGFKVPIRLLGAYRAAALHDRIVAKSLEQIHRKSRIDIVHCWPSGALETLKAARELGIKSVLERPSAHTRYVFEATANECEKLGINMPRSHYTAFDRKRLLREENEFELVDRLLCPSEWVAKTFLDQGISENRIARHQYGFDPEKFVLPSINNRHKDKSFKMIFVGSGEPRKGLHYALDAWLASDACKKGVFYICGIYVQGYREVLAKKLFHPSIKELGFQNDVNSLFQKCHAMVLPSISEGSAIVTYEARASGCVLLISEASGAHCKDMHDALIHKVGDVSSLTEHINMLASNDEFYQKIHRNSIAGIGDLTWAKAGESLLSAYQQCLDGSLKTKKSSGINVCHIKNRGK